MAHILMYRAGNNAEELGLIQQDNTPWVEENIEITSLDTYQIKHRPATGWDFGHTGKFYTISKDGIITPLEASMKDPDEVTVTYSDGTTEIDFTIYVRINNQIA